MHHFVIKTDFQKLMIKNKSLFGRSVLFQRKYLNLTIKISSRIYLKTRQTCVGVLTEKKNEAAG